MTVSRGEAVAIARECGDALRSAELRSVEQLEQAISVCQHIVDTGPDYAKPDWRQRISALNLELERRIA